MQSPSFETIVHTCADCGERSPATETGYTLISARHGWRLSLKERPGGPREAVWRCPACWRRHRGTR